MYDHTIINVSRSHPEIPPGSLLCWVFLRRTGDNEGGLGVRGAVWGAAGAELLDSDGRREAQEFEGGEKKNGAHCQ